MNKNTRYFEAWSERIREKRRGGDADLAELVRRLEIAKVRAGSTKPPIDLGALARAASVVGVVQTELAFRGRIVEDGHGLVIEVNASLPRPEQRFTVAHEIAHLFVEGDSLRGTMRKGRGRITRQRHAAVEALCDRLAGEILVPRQWLKQRLERDRVALETVRKSALEAEVPIGCIVRRIVDDGLWRVRFIRWVMGDGRFSAVESWPEVGEDFLAQLECAAGASVLKRAILEGQPVEGHERLRSRDGETEYLIQCLAIDAQGMRSQTEILSALVFD